MICKSYRIPVADQIFNYYSLFEQYEKYVKWFENYPMAKYNREVAKYRSPFNPSSKAEWEKQAAAVLPNGYKDVPYFDHYLNALNTNRFHTYYDLCNFINEIRRRDEMERMVKDIANTQKKIVAQNSTIISNQNMLYAQSERHHKESMRVAVDSYNGIMKKLDNIQDSIDSIDREIIIYY